MGPLEGHHILVGEHGAVAQQRSQRFKPDDVRREGASFEDALPAPLRLRKESERLARAAGAGEPPSEAALRAAVADLNRRITDWRRIPVGPPVYVKLADEEALVAAWRQARARPAAADAAAAPARDQGRRWPRRWRRRPAGPS